MTVAQRPEETRWVLRPTGFTADRFLPLTGFILDMFYLGLGLPLTSGLDSSVQNKLNCSQLSLRVHFKSSGVSCSVDQWLNPQSGFWGILIVPVWSELTFECQRCHKFLTPGNRSRFTSLRKTEAWPEGHFIFLHGDLLSPQPGQVLLTPRPVDQGSHVTDGPDTRDVRNMTHHPLRLLHPPNMYSVSLFCFSALKREVSLNSNRYGKTLKLIARHKIIKHKITGAEMSFYL